MEPDVIRMYSSSPPPMEDAAEEEDDEFSDFTGVPNSVSFTEFDTPVVFDQSQALTATSPPELLNNGRVVGLSDRGRAGPAKANGVVSGGCQEIGHTVRTVSAEELKRLAEHARTTPHTNSLDPVEGSRTEANAIGFDNGVAGSEVLTNGFADSDTQGTPPLSHKNGDPDLASSEEACPVPCHDDDDDDFADFSAFSHTDAPGHSDQHTVESDDREKERQEENVDREDDSSQAHNEGGSVSNAEGEVDIRDACDAGLNLPPFPVETSGGLVNGEWGLHTRAACGQRDHDTDTAHQDSTNATEPACAEQPVTLNGNVAENGVEKGAGDSGDNRASPVLEIEKEAEQPDEKGSSGNETETETETSFGRPLSTDALEEFGDFSTTGSVPSPPLQEEMATPADHSQLAEDDDEDFGDFGDFGDAGSFSANAFADFDQQGAAVQTGSLESESKPPKETSEIGEEEFGDFDASGECRRGTEDDEVANFASFPGSDSFADFHSAPVDQGADDAEDGWQAFSEQEQSQGGSESWAAFDQDPGGAAVSESNEDERHQSQPYSAPPADSDENSRNDSTTAVLVSRLEKLFLVSFPEAPVPEVGEEVAPLKAFLEPADKSQSEEADRTPANGAVQNVWQQLLDIHNAFGLRHQWGGSHNNKTLLCSLGIDTRNILFTGQKKQPVIVPMYAASLGMLEPTKEPVKPVSAAEMIASIAQAPPVATEMPSCPPDAAQESLPPVQFDWSSSGLTNPLDASGGSSLLNLDFFGPVDESTSSTATSIPGVDPELYELTTAKLDPGGGGSRVADAFARLMSTVEKTSTSTRKPRKQENLSEEAQRVIAGLPDLSFMQAKVLMFPTSLTPLDSSTSSSPMPD